MFPYLITRLHALKICRQISTSRRRISVNRVLKCDLVSFPKVKICLPKLRDLNPFVTVTRREEEITEDYIRTFRVHFFVLRSAAGRCSYQSPQQGARNPRCDLSR